MGKLVIYGTIGPINVAKAKIKGGKHLSYIAHNYSLLQEVHVLLESFPFSESVEETLNSMDLAGISNTYSPYSEIENDSVANAICWSVDTLQSLLAKQPVRTLDEVLSFGGKVLKDRPTVESS